VKCSSFNLKKLMRIPNCLRSWLPLMALCGVMRDAITNLSKIGGGKAALPEAKPTFSERYEELSTDVDALQSVVEIRAFLDQVLSLDAEVIEGSQNDLREIVS